MERNILYLIRHGQYTHDAAGPGEGHLTDRGRDQARLVAQRLQSQPISTIYCSTLDRAIETAEIIAAALPGVPVRRSPDLAECIPCLPSDDADAFASCTPEELANGAQQAGAAFATHFTRPGDSERREVLVCHGNIIRYFVCRALRIPPEAWGRLSSHNCGVSEVSIFPDGFMMLGSYNDVGHLPEHLLTRS